MTRKRCPCCAAALSHCPECGRRFPHGTVARCPEPECQQVNAPIDCDGCYRVVADDLSGVIDFWGKLYPYESHVDAREFETPEYDIHRQNPDNRARQVEGLCSYYERQI